MSPVKVSGNCKYFDCTLQTATSVTRAVCFSPEKRQAFEKHEKAKSPVKLARFRSSTKYGKEDLIIDRATMVTPISPEDAFEYKELELSPVVTISSLDQISAEQLVSLKAKVTKVDGTKVITTNYTSNHNNSNQLKKQEVLIVDTTKSIKLILWEQHVDCVETGKTYLFDNLRLKKDNSGIKYLNTPKTAGFSVKEVEDFKQLLAEVQDVLELTTINMTATILGVQILSKYLSCLKCGKKTTTKPGSKIAQCDSCKMVQNATNCNTQWFARLLFQNVQNTKDRIELSVFHEVTKMIDLANDPKDMNTISADALTEILLCLDELQITYHAIQKKVITIA